MEGKLTLEEYLKMFPEKTSLDFITNPEVAVEIALGVREMQQQIENYKRAPLVFTTRSGIVLKIRPVPSHVTREVLRQLKEPKVPVFHNDAKERDEENPRDPTYLAAVDEFKNKQVDLSNRTYLLYTEVLGLLPEGIDSPTDSTWSDELKFIGVEVHDSGRERYVDWLKFYALTDADFKDLMTAMYVAGGLVSEEDIAAAITSFPDNKNGTANTDVPTRE